MGGFVAITSAAFYGDYFDNIIVVAGSAGSPHSQQPSEEVQQELMNPNLTEAGLLNLTFPLQFPIGMCSVWLWWLPASYFLSVVVRNANPLNNLKLSVLQLLKQHATPSLRRISSAL